MHDLAAVKPCYRAKLCLLRKEIGESFNRVIMQLKLIFARGTSVQAACRPVIEACCSLTTDFRSLRFGPLLNLAPA